MREQQKSFWDADNDTIKEVQSKEGVQGVVRKPLIDLTRIGETNEISGHGIETTIDGHKVLAGNGRLMKSKNIPYQECDGIGTVIYLAKDGKFAGMYPDCRYDQAGDGGCDPWTEGGWNPPYCYADGRPESCRRGGGCEGWHRSGVHGAASGG